MRVLRIGMAQINPTVGDLEGNTRKIIQSIEKARDYGAEIVTFPELAITGYPPEDLLLKPQFIADNIACLERIIPKTQGICAVVGFVDRQEGKEKQLLYNAAAVVDDRSLLGIYHKMLLPNYGVFDEKRYFQEGDNPQVYQVCGTVIGVNICEDVWFREGPCRTQAAQGGAQVIFNISASPYHKGKWTVRQEMLAGRAKDHGVIIAYTNMVGGQDELVFDGHSLVHDQKGRLVARGRQFEEDLILIDLDIAVEGKSDLGGKARGKPPLPSRAVQPPDPLGEVYAALVLGTRDYVRKNGFTHTIVGLSGGIDSAITAVIAADAVGKENVMGVFMPSQFTSQESEEDVQQLVKSLGIKLVTIPIQSIMEAYNGALASSSDGKTSDVTEENLQARIRGNLLMAFSNTFGCLVLTTGNKSEMSVGYATLYGDMAGGFAVIKDVPKTLVYELAAHRNRQGARTLIPQRVFDKEPTAELKPGQKDTDTLPPYSLLDPILQAYIEEDRSPGEIIAMGHEEKIVKKVVEMVDRSEYKRRQAPPGVKITQRAFGKDRRIPITNRYRQRGRI